MKYPRFFLSPENLSRSHSFFYVIYKKSDFAVVFHKEGLNKNRYYKSSLLTEKDLIINCEVRGFREVTRAELVFLI